MSSLKRLICVALLLLPAVPLHAENAVKDGRVFTRKTLGEVHRVDMAEREAIISGFRYYFGSAISGDTSKISMLGYNSGSFELLKPGMKLYIEYAETGVSRYVTRARQLPYDTDIHDRATRLELLN